MSETLVLYAVRSRDGKWFRNVGFGHAYRGGKGWVEELQNAKLYAKIGQARSRITFFARRYPDYGVPDLVELTMGSMRVIDETARVEKVTKRKAQEVLNAEKRRINYELEEALRKKDEYDARIKKLREMKEGKNVG